jgi:acyl carrier protein
MERYEQIMQAIYDAIGEVNQMLAPEQTLERSPDTVLIGDGKLDSLRFLELTLAVEGNIERGFKKTISVTEVALLGDEPDPLTVATLAERIARLVGCAAQG